MELVIHHAWQYYLTFVFNSTMLPFFGMPFIHAIPITNLSKQISFLNDQFPGKRNVCGRQIAWSPYSPHFKPVTPIYRVVKNKKYYDQPGKYL